MQDKAIHQGRNVKRIREMLGMKQEALAFALGDDWNQKKISMLETKEEIEPALLDEVAKALRVPIEAIRNFDEDKAVNIISNTITNHDNSSVYGTYHINAVEKWMDALEENKRLYERLLQSEQEKNALLQQLLNEKNQ